SFLTLLGLAMIITNGELSRSATAAATDAVLAGNNNNLLIGPDVQVDTLRPPTAYDVYEPNIGRDSSGHVYYSWFEAIYGLPSSEIIRFRSSSDYGMTFDRDPIEIPITRPGRSLNDVQMCNDNVGHVYITWIHAISFAGDHQLYFTHSSDYGRTWSAR